MAMPHASMHCGRNPPTVDGKARIVEMMQLNVGMRPALTRFHVVVRDPLGKVVCDVKLLKFLGEVTDRLAVRMPKRLTRVISNLGLQKGIQQMLR